MWMSKVGPGRTDLPQGDSHGSGWRARLRADFRLAIVTTFGVCTMLAIAPFTVFRFLARDWATAAADSSMIVGAALIVAYAWKGKRVERAGTLMTVFMTVGFLFNVTVGNASYLWAYPLLAASFLMAQRWSALVIGSVAILVLALQPQQFESVVENWSFVITAALVAVFGLIFASQAEKQRNLLEHSASQDPLTGAGNRRALRRALDEAMEQFTHQARPVSIVLLDLDHFKVVNDHYGHEAGDRVLVELVARVRESVRERDHVFRLGGEEFVVVLPETDASGAECAAEKLRREVAARLHGPGGPITVSIGVAELSAAESVADWLVRADKALYEAKRSGRNRVVMAQPAGR